MELKVSQKTIRMKHSKRSFGIVSLLLFLVLGCGKKSTEGMADSESDDTSTAMAPALPAVAAPQNISDLLPAGAVVFSETEGDLNNDGLPDKVVMIKGTDASRWVTDENRGRLDRNRRGILILFKTQNGYQLAAQNDTCFASENEEGGVYYAPELDLTVEKGKLYIHYAHGRYGYWRYTFWYQEGGFKLIGYDASDNQGPVVLAEASINFLTGKKIVKNNTNPNTYDGEEEFVTEKSNIAQKRLMDLEKVQDFEVLELPE